MWEFITEHWPKGVFLSAIGLTGWLSRRELKRNDDDHKDLDERLQTIEDKPFVTADVIDELRSSMTASMVNLADRIEAKMDRMHDQNTVTMDRTHARVDDLWKNMHAGAQR